MVNIMEPALRELSNAWTEIMQDRLNFDAKFSMLWNGRLPASLA
jgi:hypothetical protein